MRIRLFTILLSCLLPLVCYAQQPEDNLPEPIQLARMNVITVGGGVTAPAGGCPSGTYLFAWNGDHPSGSMYACDSGGTAYNASANSGGTLHADYGQSGIGYGITGADQYIEWDDNFSLAGLVVTTGAATIWMSVRVPSPSTPDPNVLELYNSIVTPPPTQDFCELIIYNGNDPAIGWNGAGTGDGSNWGGTAITADTWARVGITWDMEEADTDFCAVVDSGVWECDDDDPVDFSATAAMKVLIGERYFGGANLTVYIDNVYIISGYQQADPL